MKKITAVILSFAMLLAFAACGDKQIKENETTAEAKAEQITEEQTNTVNANGYLTATEADLDVLSDVVFGIIRCGADVIPVFPDNDLRGEEYVELVRGATPEDYENAYFYNSASENALGDAMYMIFNTSAMGFLNFIESLNIEVEEEFYCKYGNNGELVEMVPDPLNQYADSFGYLKFNADNIDFILRNVLCVEPDRTKTDEDFDSSRYHALFNYYYCDGYYYYEYDEGGGGDPFINIIGYEQQPDGSYIVRFSDYNDTDTMTTDYETLNEVVNENYVYTIYETSAALKEIDGQKIWSVSYLKPAEYVVYVDTLQNS